MFNRPTDIAIHPINRDLFISDGYGNSRIHKFDSYGRHILSWGSPGTEPGEFSLPHNITILGNDKVAVCDRENFRVQIFSLDGEYIKQINLEKYDKGVYIVEIESNSDLINKKLILQ